MWKSGDPDTNEGEGSSLLGNVHGEALRRLPVQGQEWGCVVTIVTTDPLFI